MAETIDRDGEAIASARICEGSSDLIDAAEVGFELLAL
jgi:hypothetical protein